MAGNNIAELFISLGVKPSPALKKLTQDLNNVKQVSEQAMSQLGSFARNSSGMWDQFSKTLTGASRAARNASAQMTGSIVKDFNAQVKAAEAAIRTVDKYGTKLAKKAANESHFNRVVAGLNRTRRRGGGVGPGFFDDPYAQFQAESQLRKSAPGTRKQGPVHPVFRALQDDLNGVGEGSGMFSGGGARRASNSDLEAAKVANRLQRGRRGGGVGPGFFAEPEPYKPAPMHPVFRAMQDDLNGDGEGSDMFIGPRVRKSRTSKAQNEAHFNRIVRDIGSSTPADDTSRPDDWIMQPDRRGFFGKMADRWRRARDGGGGGGGKSGGGAGGPGRFGRFLGGAKSVLGGGGGRFGGAGEIRYLRGLLFGTGIYQGVQEFGQLADTYTRLQMRLEGVTKTQGEAANVFNRLRKIAKSTNIDLESTTEGYVRIRHATEGMKLSEEDLFTLMQNLNTLMATSGASTQEAASGMRQLTQALAKGKLDGDEFKSIAENMPNILKVLTKSLGVTEGQLRKMSKDGELTRDKLVNALIKVKGLQKPVETFGSAWQKFKDDLMITFGELAKNENLVEDFTELLKYFSKAVVLLARSIPPIIRNIRDWAKALQEGQTWAFMVAGVLGAILLPTLFRLLAFPFLRLITLFEMLGGAWRFAGVMGRFFAGGAAAAGASKLGSLGMAGAGAGAAAKGASKIGKIGKGAAAAGSLFGGIPGLILGGMLIADEFTDGAVFQSLGGTLGKMVSQPEFIKDYATTGGARQSVTIGDINIEVNAQDGTDAGQQIAEELKKLMRQSGAGL